MFGLEYYLALTKIGVDLALAIVTAIVFYYSWNCIAPVYLVQYLPVIFIKLPYWHIVALLLIIKYIGQCINQLTPKFISISNNK